MFETSLIERLYREKKENSDGDISSDSEYDEALKSSKDKNKNLNFTNSIIPTEEDRSLIESIDPNYEEYVKEKIRNKIAKRKIFDYKCCHWLLSVFACCCRNQVKKKRYKRRDKFYD